MGKNSKNDTSELTDKRLKPSFSPKSDKTPLKEFSLITDPLKEFFLNYTPDSMQSLAHQRLYNFDIAAQNVMRYHLDFALESVDIEIDSDLPEEETSRLAQFYSRNPLFKDARDEFQKACEDLAAIDSECAFQVISHVHKTINDVIEAMRCKKQIEYIDNNPSPFSSPSSSPNGKTQIH